MNFGITRTLARKEDVIAAAPDRHTGLRGVAKNLSLRLVDKATIELLTEALCRLVVLAYDHDRAGYIKIDGVTGRLLIPAPWRRAGRSKWGLYPSEADTLRLILQGRMRPKAVAPLFVYDKGRRSWLVNLDAYPDEAAAQAYIERYPISVEEFRIAHKRATGKLRRK